MKAYDIIAAQVLDHEISGHEVSRQRFEMLLGEVGFLLGDASQEVNTGAVIVLEEPFDPSE